MKQQPIKMETTGRSSNTYDSVANGAKHKTRKYMKIFVVIISQSALAFNVLVIGIFIIIWKHQK